MFWKETDLQETFLKHTEISTIEAQLKEKKKLPMILDTAKVLVLTPKVNSNASIDLSKLATGRGLQHQAKKR